MASVQSTRMWGTVFSLSLRSRLHMLCLCVTLVIHLTLQPVSASQRPSSLKEITDGNWEDILAGEWMIKFFAPWCPACQQLQPAWSEFADWGEDMGVNIAKVDVTEQPGLSGRFIITSLPTIYHCKDGVFRKYQGARTKNDFLAFVDEQKWQAIEPVSSWFGPSSFLMNSMSALFKLSMFIRRCHNYMTDQLGIPVWGSYIIFGLATLFSGLALGLILVFIADFVFPSRRFSSSDYYQKKQSLQQARLLQQQEADHEADGEEDDDEDEDEDEEEEEFGEQDQDEDWTRRRGSPEGRPETGAQGFTEEAVRKRIVAQRQDEEEDT
ncbi:thioredoxin-related transmembrane protein 1 [Gadus morhua]|nr:thioredoxin-related transmembrane protein 1 [Gadus morhua]